MGIRFFFRKLFRIPSREYRALYQQYADAESALSAHRIQVEPYKPVGTVVRESIPVIDSPVTVQTFSPLQHGKPYDICKKRDERIRKEGTTVERYDSFFMLCQRAESLLGLGDRNGALAICDGLEESASSIKSHALLNYYRTIKEMAK